MVGFNIRQGMQLTATDTLLTSLKISPTESVSVAIDYDDYVVFKTHLGALVLYRNIIKDVEYLFLEFFSNISQAVSGKTFIMYNKLFKNAYPITNSVAMLDEDALNICRKILDDDVHSIKSFKGEI